MKKVILILVAVIGFGISANAGPGETCKIKGATDGSSVEITSCYLGSGKDEGKVIVIVDNDSRKIPANVKIGVTVTYENSSKVKKTYDYTGKGRAVANQSTRIEIPIKKTHPESTSHNSYNASSVKATSITGNKCE